MDVTQRIEQQLKSNPVVLFMKGTPDFPQCGFSAAVVARARRLRRENSPHVNIFEDPELREALKRYSNWPTYPQLYVDGELIGGADIIQEMHRSGELQAAGRGRARRLRRIGSGHGECRHVPRTLSSIRIARASGLVVGRGRGFLRRLP